MAAAEIGMDLGTSSVLIYRGKNIVLREPAVIAINRENNKPQAVGETARQMLGRTPDNIVAIRPLKRGVIDNFTATELMVREFLQKAGVNRSFRKPSVCVTVPSGASDIERRALMDAVREAGAREVRLVEAPVAAALGANIEIFQPCGNLIVDIGAGTSDVCVMSLGEPVVSCNIAVAGDDFDDAIVRYLRRRYNLLVGESTAEKVKMTIGTCYPVGQEETMEVRGRNVVTGLPRTIEISSEEIGEALRDPAMAIVDTILTVLEKTPPELAADIAERGIVLTGGGAQLRGLEELIEENTGINTMIAEDPGNCAAVGTGKYESYMASHREA